MRSHIVKWKWTINTGITKYAFSYLAMLAHRTRLSRVLVFVTSIFIGFYFYLALSTVVTNVSARIHSVELTPRGCLALLNDLEVMSSENNPFPVITPEDRLSLDDMMPRRKYLKSKQCKEFVRSAFHEFVVLESVRRATIFNTDVVTFVTQLSSTRFDRLQKVMENWEGPISAAVYVQKSDIGNFSKLFCDPETFGIRTNVDIHIVIQAGNYYPINTLRNVALQLTRTPLAFLSDVDFIPGRNTHKEITTFYQKDQNFFGENVLVVPAFEVQQGNEEIGIPEGKDDVLRLLEIEHIKEARVNKWNPGHMPTKYDMWKTSQDIYQVDYSEDYEPYIVIRTDLSPKYDKHFVERFRDKAQQIMEVWARGMKFFVMPNTFTIHYPHSYLPKQATKAIYLCAVSIYQEFRQYISLRYNIKQIYQFKEEPIMSNVTETQGSIRGNITGIHEQINSNITGIHEQFRSNVTGIYEQIRSNITGIHELIRSNITKGHR